MRDPLARELADYSQRVHARGWAANHDANLSARDGVGRFVCTPTAVSKAAVEPDMLLVVDADGNRVSGRLKPFGELDLHLAVYRARPDAQAVLHAHPPTACGFAVAGVEVPAQILAEPVVSLGARIPTLPYFAPKSAAQRAAIEAAFSEHDVVLLGNHGVLACGADVEQAFLRVELVEHLAKIALVATQLGGARTIPAGDVAELLKARTKAGLGAEARKPVAPPAPKPAGPIPLAGAPAPGPAAVPGVREIVHRIENRLGAGKVDAKLLAMIVEEVAAAQPK